MNIDISDSRAHVARQAGDCVAQAIRQAIDNRGEARIILCTVVGQYDLPDSLADCEVPWERVEVFHMGEYLGISPEHPGSCRHRLHERFAGRLPELISFHRVQGDAPDSDGECERLTALLSRAPIDLACLSVGPDGGLGFNLPPADFEEAPRYRVVRLTDSYRQHHVGEHFNALDEVPRRAISMNIAGLLQAGRIVCTATGQNLAQVVQKTVEEPVSENWPASILHRHADCRLLLDEAAASLLNGSAA